MGGRGREGVRDGREGEGECERWERGRGRGGEGMYERQRERGCVADIGSITDSMAHAMHEHSMQAHHSISDCTSL